LHILYRNAFVFLASGIILCAGCAASSSPATQADPGLEDVSYSNFLVIGVAGDYNNRAYFERSVVSGIRAKGSSARAFHVVTPGNKPLTREAVKDAIESGGFDAVLVSRVLDTDTDLDVKKSVTGTKVTRKDGGVLDLFRYNYEDLDEPMSLELKTKVKTIDRRRGRKRCQTPGPRRFNRPIENLFRAGFRLKTPNQVM